MGFSETLQDYVLVNGVSQGVEVYRINAAGKWELTPYFPEADSEPITVEFPSLNFQCAIADIYEDVNFSPEPDTLFNFILAS